MGRYLSSIDWVTAILLLCLSSFGLFLLATIQQELFFQQTIFLGIGILLMIACSRIDAEVLWWLAPYGYLVANIFLFLSYFGPSVRGATRWIFIGGIQLQPSELVKPLMLLAFARFISEYPPRTLRNVLIHSGLFLIPFLLVLKQPDLGSSIVYGSFWFAMLLAGGLSVVVLAGISLANIVIVPLTWRILAGYQKQRILTFLDPALDPGGAGYNAIQAMIAVGSGQIFGRGLGRGTQSHLRFLPEFHTDFIFATLIEEFGFLGGMLLLVIYGMLLWRIIRPLVRGIVTDIFPFTFSVGVLILILSQLFINAGMNMGIIPVTGITLPFVSYGGSSLLSLSITFGLLWAMERNTRTHGPIAIA